MLQLNFFFLILKSVFRLLQYKYVRYRFCINVIRFIYFMSSMVLDVGISVKPQPALELLFKIYMIIMVRIDFYSYGWFKY